MNKSVYIILIISVLPSAFTQCLFAADSYVDEFGIEDGNSIDNGFVFIDGQYINSPYKVSRRGLGLFVNNRKIARPARHPGEKPLFGGVDPQQLSAEKRARLFRPLETARQVYESHLKKGNCLFFFREGGYRKFGPYATAYILPSTLKKVRSAKSNKAKLDRLDNSSMGNYTENKVLNKLIDNYTHSPQLDARLNSLAQSLLRTEEFGIETGKPVEEGFVFVDGKYIDAPYIVTRKGLALFINDQMIAMPMGGPLPEKKVVVEPVDPALPSTITIDSSKYDPDVRQYLGAKNAYYTKNFSRAEADQLMVQAYEALPCVQNAASDPNSSGIVQITWVDGSISHTRLTPIKGRKPIKRDKQSILSRLNAQRSDYEYRLEKGDYYLFSIMGGRITGGAAQAAKILPEIVPILRSSEPKDIKVKAIRNSGLPVPIEGNEEIIEDFTASEQLEQRLARLQKRKG